jgi:diacylglycerol kinase family enzyme
MLAYRCAVKRSSLDATVIIRHGFLAFDVATRALMVTISNAPYTGVEMTVAPDARLNDGKFDVRIFRHFSKWELTRHLASITFGRRRCSPHVTTHRSANVTVVGKRPFPAAQIRTTWVRRRSSAT